jgi:hypothetical protein
LKRLLLISGSLVAFLAIAVLGLATWSVLASRTVEKVESASSALAAGLAVSAQSDNGFIAVEAGPGPEVMVDATIRARNEERLRATRLVLVESDDGRCEVYIEWPEGKRQRGEGADLRLRLPAVTEVHLQTSNGDIRVDGLRAAVRAVSTNGAIRVVGPAQRIDAATTNGTVDLHGVTGPVRVRSTNGRFSIALDPDNPGPVYLTTTNGGGELAVGPAFIGSLSVRTSNGRITLEGFEAHELPDTVKTGGRVGLFDFGPAEHGSTLRTTNGAVRIRPNRQ